MNAPPMAAEPAMPTDSRRDIRIVIALLTLGFLGLGLLFQAEVVAAVQTWEASTAYNHCFLIIPITIYMIWDRRDDFRGIRAEPFPVAAVLGVVPAVGWLVAERLGIMEGRQLMVITFVEVLLLAVLGWRLSWAMAGPLLYLFFLVPFGEFLVPRLQDFTAIFISFGLGLTSIPAYIDGYIIEIPAGTFYVAEACAGLRFLVASIAFGVLYALMMYRSPLRRTVFIVASIIVPIVANGFRALGIVLLGHLLGSAEAAAADHILYGWIFFSIVILLLTLIGLPFREDMQDARPPQPRSTRQPIRPAFGVAVVVIAVAVAAIGPAVTAAQARTFDVAEIRPFAMNLPHNCRLGALPTDIVREGVGRQTQIRVLCHTLEFDITVQIFSPRITAGPITQERRRLTRPRSSENVAETLITDPVGQATNWRLIHSTSPNFLTVAGVWIDGKPSEMGFSMRISQARDSLFGSMHAPALVVISPRLDLETVSPSSLRDIEKQLISFVLAQPNFNEQMRAATRLAGS